MISKLEEVAKKEEIFGNKARNLSILINQGILVPKGIAISYEQYIDYLELGFLREDFERELSQKLDDYSFQFAVRSSANVEDSKKKSYAGQFKTFLDVSKKDIFKTIKQIYDSAINFNNSYSDNPIRMAIIIQEMINAEISGVLFTYNLIDQNPESLMVELSKGECEKIVSGKTNPSLYVLDKKSGDTILFEEGHQSVYLNENMIYKIISNAERIESIFKKPQDIEFLFNSGRFYCLQSRNITTI